MVSVISLIIVSDFLVQMITNRLSFRPGVLLTISLLILLGMQLLSHELWNGHLEFVNIIMRILISALLILLTVSRLSDQREVKIFLSWANSITIIVVFCSVIFQLGYPDIWNSIALVSERWVSDQGQTGRAFGLMFNALDLVFLSATLLIILHLNKGLFSSRWHLILSTIVHFQLFLTFSRVGIAVLLISVLITLKQWLTIRGITLAVVLILIAGSSNLFYGSGLERLTALKGDASSFANGFSTENRKGIYAEAYDNIELVPIATGLGYSGRDKVIDDRHRSHNTFIESYISAGLPGIIMIFLIMVITGLKLSKKTKQQPLIYFVFFVPFASYLTIGHTVTMFTFYYLILIGNIPVYKKVNS